LWIFSVLVIKWAAKLILHRQSSSFSLK
jgi:hypothetical protein